MGLMAFMFMFFGIFSGLLMVPLNAHIQFLSPNVHLGTILAGSNFIQNIFMFSFLVLTTIFAYFGMNAEILFYLMAVVGIYLTVMLARRYMVMTFWATMEIISRTRHKYSYEGLQNIPSEKAVLLLGNHVSWLDWIILQLPMKRRINFMMDKDIYHWPLFNRIFKKGETIPLSSRASKDAFKEAHTRLIDGKMVAIYPEGGITKDGELGKFYRGYEIIPQNYDGVIVPFYIEGVLQGILSGIIAFGVVFISYQWILRAIPNFEDYLLMLSIPSKYLITMKNTMLIIPFGGIMGTLGGYIAVRRAF